jgi:hypothetical protein
MPSGQLEKPLCIRGLVDTLPSMHTNAPHGDSKRARATIGMFALTGLIFFGRDACLCGGGRRPEPPSTTQTQAGTTAAPASSAPAP